MTPLTIPVLVWSVDLALSDGGFVDGGSTGQWEWGEVVVGPSGNIGPVWGTNLAGPYLHESEDWLEIQLPDLTDVAVPSLVLTHWYSVRDGDQAIVQIQDETGTFVRLDPAYGYPTADGFIGETPAYGDAVFDVSGYGTAPKIRLLLTSDARLADLGWYVSDLALWDGDVLPPTVTVNTPLGDTQDLEGPYAVQAQVLDDRSGAVSTLWYTIDGGPPVSAPMMGSPATGFIPGQAADTEVAYWVEATDGQNVGRWPATGQDTFRVFLAPPTKLEGEGPSLRNVGDHVTLTWSAPLSPHTVLGYWVVREGETDPLVQSTDAEATVPLEPDVPQRFQVYAVYDVGLSDPSTALALDIEVPALDLVAPSSGLPGQDVVVRLEGRSLYLLEGATSVDLGADTEVVLIDVVDVGEAVVTAHVVHGAVPGPRDVTLSTPVGTFLFDDAFTIVDPAAAPGLSAFTPDTLTQGETGAFVAEGIAGPDVLITVDEDLTVVGAPSVNGDSVSFTLRASDTARLGAHTIGVDDGVQLYVVEVEVLDNRSSLRTGCATAPAASAPVGLLLLALARRRRARG